LRHAFLKASQTVLTLNLYHGLPQRISIRWKDF
jgi:hypothetical protein